MRKVARTSAACCLLFGATAAAQFAGNGLSRASESANRTAGAQSREEQPASVACFAPGTPIEVIREHEAEFGARYNTYLRWRNSALGEPSYSSGAPIRLTYSFVPDGTNVPAVLSHPAAPSNLFSFFNAVYGSESAWQALYHEEFERWAQATGITFLHEPNDDGASLLSPGIAGVRGDIRLAAAPIDGYRNIVAYAYYPDFGDIVIDSSDGSYGEQSGDPTFAGHIIAHEIGHAIGLLHTCPLENTKLMEPRVWQPPYATGPQLDDLLGGHEMYGDGTESHDPEASSHLGTSDSLPLRVENVSILGSDVDLFVLDVVEPRSLSVELVPTENAPYLEGSQLMNGDCEAGTLFSPGTQDNLRLEVFDPSGAPVTGLGEDGLPTSELVDGRDLAGAERVSIAALEAGPYTIRVSGSGFSIPQMYSMSVSAGPSMLAPSEPLPDRLSALTPTPIRLIALPAPGDFVADESVRGYFREGDGPFTETQAARLSDGRFEISLPPMPCDASPEIYFVASFGGRVDAFLPPLGAQDPIRLSVGEQSTVVDLDFEMDPGWSVYGDADSGHWELATPAGIAPGPDSDADGSGQCWLTSPGVAGGETVLETTAFPASESAHVSYQFWMNTDPEGSGSLDVQVQTDGGEWRTVRSYWVPEPSWRHDRLLISEGSLEQSDGDSRDPAISADGRFVAFSSRASNLVAGDTNGFRDIFVRDRALGTTRRISVTSGGEQANNHSDRPAISPEGRHIAFSSIASNLVPGDTPGRDIFLHDLAAGTTVMVSRGLDGGPANGLCDRPSVSSNGAFVAFGSRATNLTDDIDLNGDSDVFVADMRNGGIVRASVSSTGAVGNQRSFTPSISANGLHVIFRSDASNLVAGDNNGRADVFRRNLDLSTTQWVNKGFDSGTPQAAVISGDGRYTAFVAEYGDMGLEIIRKHRQDLPFGYQAFNRVDFPPVHPRLNPSLSFDGAAAAFESAYRFILGIGDASDSVDVFLRHTPMGHIELVSRSSADIIGDGPSFNGKVSGNGRFIAFESDATNLVPGDTNGERDVFVRDMLTGQTTRVSVSSGGDAPQSQPLRLRFIARNAGMNPSLEAGIDGFLIDTFGCASSDACAADTNGDNVVDFSDLNAVLVGFGQFGPALPGDVDGDGVVDFADLNAVLVAFGTVCD